MGHGTPIDHCNMTAPVTIAPESRIKKKSKTGKKSKKKQRDPDEPSKFVI